MHSASFPPICSLMRLIAIVLAILPVQAAEPGDPSFLAAMAAQRESVRVMRASIERQRSLRRPAPACRPLPESQINLLAEQAGARERISSDLLRAVIDVESAACPCAVSPKGALGLMQLMPATAVGLNVENPFDPKENVDAGARFLKQLLTRYDGDLTLALGAYNAGPSRVDEAGGVPDIPETVDYVSRILSRLGSTASVR